MQNLKMIFFDQVPYCDFYGNGDSAYVELPDGKTMLIDISRKEPGLAITDKLIKMGVRQIDFFIASHFHSDHTEGFCELANRIPVKCVIMSGYGRKSIEADGTFLEAIQRHQIPVKEMRMGDRLNIGEAELQFLFPPRDVPEISSEKSYVEQETNSNIYSMVFRISYKKFSALFAGDIYEQSEKQLIYEVGNCLRSTVLKIPHHGNDTSTSQAFLDTVKPQLAVTMCRNCEWPVQQRLSNSHIVLYAPFCDGQISLKTDGDFLKVSCDKGDSQLIL